MSWQEETSPTFLVNHPSGPNQHYPMLCTLIIPMHSSSQQTQTLLHKYQIVNLHRQTQFCFVIRFVLFTLCVVCKEVSGQSIRAVDTNVTSPSKVTNLVSYRSDNWPVICSWSRFQKRVFTTWWKGWGLSRNNCQWLKVHMPGFVSSRAVGEIPW